MTYMTDIFLINFIEKNTIIKGNYVQLCIDNSSYIRCEILEREKGLKQDSILNICTPIILHELKHQDKLLTKIK